MSFVSLARKACKFTFHTCGVLQIYIVPLFLAFTVLFERRGKRTFDLARLKLYIGLFINLKLFYLERTIQAVEGLYYLVVYSLAETPRMGPLLLSYMQPKPG